MSVRDIIEAATAGPWHDDITEISHSYTRGGFTRDYPVFGFDHEFMDGAKDEDRCFIATFDPEHVALMEAVIGCVMDDSGEAKQWGFDLLDAANALAAYRRERGLL